MAWNLRDDDWPRTNAQGLQLESGAWQLLCSCHSQQPTGGHSGSGSLTTAAASSGSQMPPPPVPLQLRGRDVAPAPPRARGQQPTGDHSASGSLTTAAAGYQTLSQASDLPTLVKQDSPQDGGSLATARIAASHWSDTSTTIASASTSFFFLQVLFEGFVVVQPGSTELHVALLDLLRRWTCPKYVDEEEVYHGTWKERGTKLPETLNLEAALEQQRQQKILHRHPGQN